MFSRCRASKSFGKTCDVCNENGYFGAAGGRTHDLELSVLDSILDITKSQKETKADIVIRAGP